MKATNIEIPLSGQILGYMAPMGFPDPLLIIYKQSGGLYIRHFTGSTVPMVEDNGKTLRKTQQMSEYFEPNRIQTIDPEHFAYALSKDEILLDTHPNIKLRLEYELVKKNITQKGLKAIEDTLALYGTDIELI